MLCSDGRDDQRLAAVMLNIVCVNAKSIILKFLQQTHLVRLEVMWSARTHVRMQGCKRSSRVNAILDGHVECRWQLLWHITRGADRFHCCNNRGSKLSQLVAREVGKAYSRGTCGDNDVVATHTRVGSCRLACH